jgi:hypothetical protein
VPALGSRAGDSIARDRAPGNRDAVVEGGSAEEGGGRRAGGGWKEDKELFARRVAKSDKSRVVHRCALALWADVEDGRYMIALAVICERTLNEGVKVALELRPPCTFNRTPSTHQTTRVRSPSS